MADQSDAARIAARELFGSTMAEKLESPADGWPGTVDITARVATRRMVELITEEEHVAGGGMLMFVGQDWRRAVSADLLRYAQTGESGDGIVRGMPAAAAAAARPYGPNYRRLVISRTEILPCPKIRAYEHFFVDPRCLKPGEYIAVPWHGRTIAVALP